MFYWYVESQNDPANDPVALWTNGGPGCSGLLGFFTENGPFRPLANGSLQLNPYSWNTAVNYVFVEQPIGVGFSYSEDNDYTTGDSRAATDNYNAMQAFLTKFPEVSKNPFYITSESYGGHYMPTLAQTILEAQGNSNTPVNFKGFAVGNPYTDSADNLYGNAETRWGHQVIPLQLWEAYEQDCQGAVPHPEKCEEVIVAMNVAMGQLNPYALDYPLCAADTPTPPGFRMSSQAFWLNEYQKTARGAQSSDEMQKRLQLYQNFKEQRRKEGILKRQEVGPTSGPGSQPFENGYYYYDPCTDDYTATYLNRADVQAAIHAQTPPYSNGKWSECANIPYNGLDSLNPMMPVYEYILSTADNTQQYLVFSGDNDNVCSTMSTQDWIYDLGHDIRVPWHEYVTNVGLPSTQTQVGGFVVKFENNASNAPFTFVTVHGAGHEVPAYKPAVALYMLQNYMDGTWFN